VISVADGLAVQSFLDKFSYVSGVLLMLDIVHFVPFWVLGQLLRFTRRVSLVEVNWVLGVVRVQCAVVGKQ